MGWLIKMKLIDPKEFEKSEYAKIIDEYLYNCTNLTIGFLVETMSKIDAEPVVRCGYCKHLTADGRCLEFADDNIRPSASDFCSYGEMK